MDTRRTSLGAMQSSPSALWASAFAYWKNTTSSFWSLAYFIGSIPQVIVYGWIAKNSNDPAMLSYLMIGGPLMSIWHAVVFGIAYILVNETRARTLEYNMISRTPILLILFGKSISQMLFGIPAGVLAFLSMFAVTRQAPTIENIPLLLISLLFVILGLTVIGLLLAPIMSLGGRGGAAFSPVLPLIVSLSGFLFPIHLLPKELEIVSRMIPSSWAMSSVLQSLQGPDSAWAVISGWIYSLILSIVYLGFTLILFYLYERRLRITGTMSYY